MDNKELKGPLLERVEGFCNDGTLPDNWPSICRGYLGDIEGVQEASNSCDLTLLLNKWRHFSIFLNHLQNALEAEQINKRVEIASLKGDLIGIIVNDYLEEPSHCGCNTNLPD